jgi:hypothetical protein
VSVENSLKSDFRLAEFEKIALDRWENEGGRVYRVARVERAEAPEVREEQAMC